jgi:hypothetical protein
MSEEGYTRPMSLHTCADIAPSDIMAGSHAAPAPASSACTTDLPSRLSDATTDNALDDNDPALVLTSGPLLGRRRHQALRARIREILQPAPRSRAQESRLGRIREAPERGAVGSLGIDES